MKRIETNPKGVDIDLFWGGGEIPHNKLDSMQLLQTFTPSQMLKRQIPTHLHGIPLRSKTSTWHASALSSFGIFYNKRLLTMLKIPFPKTWDDLGKPEFFGHISNADVRLSSSFAVMNYVILLSAKTWEQGWDNLTRIAANSKIRTFAPIQ